jgi:hypothetical protein
MKRFRLAGIFFILSLLIYSCEKEPVLDKQIRIPFSGMGVSKFTHTDTTWRYLDQVKIIRFNKNDYPELKSIVFAADPTTMSSSSCVVELYNQTDRTEIPGSRIESLNTIPGEYTFSENILNSLPSKTIDLSIRFKSSIWGRQVFLNYDAFLFLER